MAAKKIVKRTGWREAIGIGLLAFSILTFLSQMSYFYGDIPILQSPPQSPPANLVGPVGAWVTFAIFMSLGVIGYLIPIVLLAIGLMLVLGRELRISIKIAWIALIFCALVCIVQMQPDLWAGLEDHLNVGAPGGLLGVLLGEMILIGLIGKVGTGLLAFTVLLVSMVMLFEIRPVQVFRKVAGLGSAVATQAGKVVDARREKQDSLRKQEKDLERQRKKLERTVRKQKTEAHGSAEEPTYARTVDEPPSPLDVLSTVPEPVEEPMPALAETDPDQDLSGALPESISPLRKPPLMSRRTEAIPVVTKPSELEAEVFMEVDELLENERVEYTLPPIEMLRTPVAEPLSESGPDLSANAKVLEETLRDFGIECKVTNVERGPVVTRYEVLPAAGVRVERIAGLSNNIGLALKALSVRVQAPIPGKGVVGIEVPNRQSVMVYLRDLLEQNLWKDSEMGLPLALGKDVGGHLLIADLAAMPHLLIAGATGAGKTVCMNSLLAGLLMSRTPDQMRLMLVDPKIVEFGPYNDLPHLVIPVITDPKKVSLGLRWAISEMEKRYKLFARVGVRNIKDFNNRPRVQQTDLFGEDAEVEKAKNSVPDTLPYIVIVIDELADLMLVAQAEIENSIARLAQLSRAVGIHMIIATQRPSVNVITGTIKANFPARIAFQVAQKVDSRTILDTIGADKLLGKGDMLYLPPGSSKLVRAQGAFASDDEIRDVVEFIKDQGSPVYISDIKDKIEGNKIDLPESDSDDELLDSAVEIIRQTRRASTSSLQRRLRIGYTRAARLMDVLEEKGIIGPPQGSDPREILIDLDGEIPQNQTVAD